MRRIRTRSLSVLMWQVGLVTFFLSAVLDNLTTAIVMVSLCRKLLGDREDFLAMAGVIVIAAFPDVEGISTSMISWIPIIIWLTSTGPFPSTVLVSAAMMLSSTILILVSLILIFT